MYHVSPPLTHTHAHTHTYPHTHSESRGGADAGCPCNVCLPPCHAHIPLHHHDYHGPCLFSPRLRSLASRLLYCTRVPAGNCLWNVSVHVKNIKMVKGIFVLVTTNPMWYCKECVESLVHVYFNPSSISTACLQRDLTVYVRSLKS